MKLWILTLAQRVTHSIYWWVQTKYVREFYGVRYK